MQKLYAHQIRQLNSEDAFTNPVKSSTLPPCEHLVHSNQKFRQGPPSIKQVLQKQSPDNTHRQAKNRNTSNLLLDVSRTHGAYE